MLLAGCDARPQSQLHGQSVLDALTEENGPKVSGIADNLRQNAEQAEQARDYGKALAYYQQLADTNPQNFQYRLKQAENARRIAKYQQAVEAYDKVLAQNPQNLEALEGKGLTYIAQAQFSKAGPLLEQVMKRNAQRWRTLNGVGLLFVAKNLPNEALSYFDAALSQQADRFVVLNNSGLTLALTGDYSRAIRALRQASQATRNDEQDRQRVDMNLALIYGLSGNLDQAEKLASRHLSREAVHNNLGFYAHLSNNDDLAKAYLNSALSNSKTFYKRAWENLEGLSEYAQN